MQEIVTTAARIAQPVRDVIGSVTVLTRAEIQRRQVRSVQELLRGEVGIGIANNGGLGKLSAMFIRGTEADQVLVLVDGVRVGSATAGTTRTEFIPIDQIERVEIVRGPRSSLYGADAIGGVVQIFTNNSVGPSISMGSGSLDTRRAAASFGVENEHSWLSVAASHIESDGINSCRASFSGGCFTDEPDLDGFRDTSGALRAGYHWGDTADIEAAAMYATGTNEYDGSFGNETDFTSNVVSLKTHLSPLDQWDLTLLIGNSRDTADDFNNGTPADSFDTERRNASVQSDWSPTSNQVVSLGVDYLDDHIDSTIDYDETSRDNQGVFGQYQVRFGNHEALLSARYDDNEQFGGHTTGNAGWKWRLSDTLALSAAWGNAFLAPSFNDLYYPDFSNPTLNPERSHSYEIGLSGSSSPVTWSLSAFQTEVDDLIAFDSATLKPQNFSEARIRGVEAEVRMQLQDWTFALGYTGLDARNRTPGANYDNELPRRPRQSARLDIGYTHNALRLGAIVNAQGARYDNVGNTAELGGFTLFDLIGEYRFNSIWSVQGKVANVSDHRYETARFYNQEGRTYFVTVMYQPGGR